MAFGRVFRRPAANLALPMFSEIMKVIGKRPHLFQIRVTLGLVTYRAFHTPQIIASGSAV
jgi:hypothetical protein